MAVSVSVTHLSEFPCLFRSERETLLAEKVEYRIYALEQVFRHTNKRKLLWQRKKKMFQLYM
jgi:hypothetical protein